jgi:porphobilinogen synthase
MEFRRLRKYRINKNIRDMFAETRISTDNLILPYFVIDGKNQKTSIPSMQGVYRYSIDLLIKDIKESKNTGIKSFLLFGQSDKKDETGSQAYSPDGTIQKAIKRIKEEIEDVIIITDVCLCGYTTHGHCGIVKNHYIDNDETIKILADISVSHAQAGADLVAPSANSECDGALKI